MGRGGAVVAVLLLALAQGARADDWENDRLAIVLLGVAMGVLVAFLLYVAIQMFLFRNRNLTKPSNNLRFFTAGSYQSSASSFRRSLMSDPDVELVPLNKGTRRPSVAMDPAIAAALPEAPGGERTRASFNRDAFNYWRTAARAHYVGDDSMLAMEGDLPFATKQMNSLRDMTVISMAQLRAVYLELSSLYHNGRCDREAMEEAYCNATGHTESHARIMSELIVDIFDLEKLGTVVYSRFLAFLAISARGSIRERWTRVFRVFESVRTAEAMEYPVLCDLLATLTSFASMKFANRGSAEDRVNILLQAMGLPPANPGDKVQGSSGYMHHGSQVHLATFVNACFADAGLKLLFPPSAHYQGGLTSPSRNPRRTNVGAFTESPPASRPMSADVSQLLMPPK